jgi:YVTN family beta-propeller protein
VSVIDLPAHQVTSSFGTLDSCSVLKLSPDGRRGYVICNSGVGVLDATSDTLLRTIQTGSGQVGFESLFFVGIKPDSSQYVVGGFFNLYVYDALTDSRLHNIALDQIDHSWLTLGQDFAYSPDGSTGYLAFPDENALLLFDTATWQLLEQIDTVQPPYYGTEPAWILQSPDGGKLYVLNELSDNVLVVDAASRNITGAISLATCGLYLPMLWA